MRNIISKIRLALVADKKTIAVAESCTGGGLSTLLTRIPGSSQYFVLGIVAYSNRSKEAVLKIPHSLISRYGAVSENVAAAMAQHIRRIARADFGIGITGIAGPGGGIAGKPAGTVFIAVSNKTKVFCQRFYLRGNRAAIRKRAALESLKLLEGLF